MPAIIDRLAMIRE